MTRTPQGGLPRPRARHHVTVATSAIERIERRADGKYRVWHSKENRCCRPMQIGVAQVCVMDDYGFLVTIEQEPVPWY